MATKKSAPKKAAAKKTVHKKSVRHSGRTREAYDVPTPPTAKPIARRKP